MPNYDEFVYSVNKTISQEDQEDILEHSVSGKEMEQTPRPGAFDVLGNDNHLFINHHLSRVN